MHFELPVGQLEKYLQPLLPFTQREEVHFQHILMTSTSEALTLCAGDGEMQLSIQHPPMAMEGCVVFPARLLFDICRASNKQSYLQATCEDNTMAIQVDQARYKIRCFPRKQFISMQSEAIVAQWRLNASAFAKALLGCQFAMAHEDFRTYLTGVHLFIDAKILTLVASDGHRLIRDRVSCQSSDPRPSLIVPKKAVNELGKLLQGVDGEALLNVGEGWLEIRTETFSVMTRLIAAQYPQVDAFIPKIHDHPLQVEVSGLLAALQQVTVLSVDKMKPICFFLTRGKPLKLTTKVDAGNYGEVLVDVDYQGPELVVGLNYRYLYEMLNSLGEGRLSAYFFDHQKGVRFSHAAFTERTHVVMPSLLT